MTVDEEGSCLDGASAETAAMKLTEVGCGRDWMQLQCGTGDGFERDRADEAGDDAAAGRDAEMQGFHEQWRGGRFYLTSPEYMASFTRKLVKAGASIVGGCCGTTPSYTRAMKSALRALDAMEGGAQVMESAASSKASAMAGSKVDPPALAERSKIGAMVAAGGVRHDGGDRAAEGDRLQ